MKKIYKTLLGLMICLVLSVNIVGCSDKEEKKDKDLVGTIDVWAWNNELLTSGIIEKFNEEYPNITINLITIPNANNAYSTKLLATLRSGVRTPDVYLEL